MKSFLPWKLEFLNSVGLGLTRVSCITDNDENSRTLVENLWIWQDDYAFLGNKVMMDYLVLMRYDE